MRTCKIALPGVVAAMCVLCGALGHEKACLVSCPYTDHGRAFSAGVPYVEMFVQGRLPPPLKEGQ